LLPICIIFCTNLVIIAYYYLTFCLRRNGTRYDISLSSCCEKKSQQDKSYATLNTRENQNRCNFVEFNFLLTRKRMLIWIIVFVINTHAVYGFSSRSIRYIGSYEFILCACILKNLLFSCAHNSKRVLLAFLLHF